LLRMTTLLAGVACSVATAALAVWMARRSARRSLASRLVVAIWRANRRWPARFESISLPAMRSATIETVS
jgi:hypothetical protein